MTHAADPMSEFGDDGMPKHVLVPINRDYDGPEDDPDKIWLYVCWCPAQLECQFNPPRTPKKGP